MNISALEPLASNWPRDSIGTVDPSLATVKGSLKLILSGESNNPAYSALESTFAANVEDEEHIKRFASDNNFTFDPSVQKLKQIGSDASAAWLSNTYDGILAHSVIGNLYGFGLRMSVFYKGNGSSTKVGSETTLGLWKLGIVRIKLNKVFPQLVLDSNMNDRGVLSSVHTSFKKSQRLHLEGDFDNYFDFYAPKGLNVNSLSVLSPNFMQIIKDSSANFDVEFYGDELILTTPDPIYTEGVMKVLDKALKEQLGYVARLESSWNYKPIATPFDMLRKEFVTGQVMKIGNKRIPVAKIIFVGFFAIIASGLLWSFVSFILSVSISLPSCTRSSTSEAGREEYSIDCH